MIDGEGANKVCLEYWVLILFKLSSEAFGTDESRVEIVECVGNFSL